MNNREAMKQLLAGFKIRRVSWHKPDDYIALTDGGGMINAAQNPCGHVFDMNHDDWVVYISVRKQLKVKKTYYKRKWVVSKFDGSVVTNLGYYPTKEEFDSAFSSYMEFSSGEWDEYTIEYLDMGDGK